jgi:hypothetical protein
MSLWHADMDGPSLARGAKVIVVNDRRIVRVVVADQILIERGWLEKDLRLRGNL